MDKLHDIVHAQAARHAIIILPIDQVTVRGIDPSSSYKSSIRISIGCAQVCLNTTLAISSNDPTQRSDFPAHEGLRRRGILLELHWTHVQEKQRGTLRSVHSNKEIGRASCRERV